MLEISTVNITVRVNKLADAGTHALGNLPFVLSILYIFELLHGLVDKGGELLGQARSHWVSRCLLLFDFFDEFLVLRVGRAQTFLNLFSLLRIMLLD